MRRLETIKKLAHKLDLTQKEAENVLKVFLETISDALLRGEKVQIKNLGAFEAYQKGPRPGLNPKTRQRVTIPPRKTVRFKPSISLQRKIKAPLLSK